MIEIREVKTKKDIHNFIEFPIKLYDGNKNFVPPIYADEKNKFNPNKNPAWNESKTKAFLAYKDGKIAGRLMGIIVFGENEKLGEKFIRFSRFDSVDDEQVAKTLFEAFTEFAKAEGIKKAHGPLGYNDLDREGLLVDGFEYESTFEEQYNYPYYEKLLLACGFKKEFDWLEYRIFCPKEEMNPRLKKIGETVLKRYNLHVVDLKSLGVKGFLKKYKDSFFDCLNKAYAPLHGVVPLSKPVIDGVVKDFNLLLDPRFIRVIADENDRVVAFGFALPSLSRSMNKCKGHLFPFGFIGVLREAKHPRYLDFGLVAVLPEYQGKGINANILDLVYTGMREQGIEYCETNLNLEDNEKVQSQWEFFDKIQHKRRRCFIKTL